MKKRLRKKLRLGEFQEFVFDVRFTFDPTIADDLLMDQWIELVEAHGMVCGGGGRVGEWEFCISAHSTLIGYRNQRRRAVEKWLKRSKQISAFEVGPVKADLTKAFLHSKRAAKKQAAINARLGIDSILDF